MSVVSYRFSRHVVIVIIIVHYSATKSLGELSLTLLLVPFQLHEEQLMQPEDAIGGIVSAATRCIDGMA